jgi:hypothetical protein
MHLLFDLLFLFKSLKVLLIEPLDEEFELLLVLLLEVAEGVAPTLEDVVERLELVRFPF